MSKDRKEYMREYREKNLEKVQAWHRAYYLRNKEKVARQSRESYLRNPQRVYAHTKKWAQKNPDKVLGYAKARKQRNWEYSLWNACRGNARTRGREFNIEVSDIVIPEVCPLLGVPITKIQGQGHQPTNPSVDRIDSTKGYIKGNVWVISCLANSMKQNATRDQLITFSQSVLSMYNES